MITFPIMLFNPLYLEHNALTSLESFWCVHKVHLVFGKWHLVEFLTVRLS